MEACQASGALTVGVRRSGVKRRRALEPQLARAPAYLVGVTSSQHQIPRDSGGMA